MQHFHVAGVGRCAVGGLGGEVTGASHDLGQVRVVDVGQPRHRRQEQVPQPAALGLDLQVLDHRRDDVRLPGSEQLLALLLVDLLRRVDVRVHEVLEPLHVLLRRRRQGKVHVVLLGS